MEFLEYLSQAGIIQKDDIQSIISAGKTKWNGDTDRELVDRGLTWDQLLELKSRFFNMPWKRVDPHTVTFNELKYVPEESAKYYHFVPIGVEGGVINIGIVDPGNIQATDALQFIVNKLQMPSKYFIISSEDFGHIITNYSNISGEVDKAITQFDEEGVISIDSPNLIKKSDKGEPSKEDKEKIVEDAPIIKIVSSIIHDAVAKDISDIHIENSGDQVKVRFRLDGILSTALVLPLNVYAGVVARIKILAKLRLDEKRMPQDGSFTTNIEGRKVEFRVSTFPTYYGEKVVMRILDSERGVKKLESLGLSETNIKAVREALSKPYGIILMTGPTGSGKSTTLFSMLNELDRDTENVVSLEDPVEYHIPGVSQSQVMPEIGYTFASGLRSILRQDPDIIMVGEIRDKETAQLAIQAALTGHLVFSTLHTNTATGAIPRLIDMGVDPYLIAPTLICAMAQRLVRTIAPGAAKEVPLDEANRKIIDKEFADLPEEFKKTLPITGNTIYEAVPTAENKLGLKGREAVFEILTVDKDIQKMILTNPVEQEIFKLARQKGMITMREDGIIKAFKGITTLQEAYGL